MVCPVYKNKKVRAQFNEIVEALGGQPMTEEEFASVELRNQRSGPNYSAMEAAYRIWNLNNGNPIDYTPNTKEETKSILFQNLLDLCGGDRTAAIRAKSKVYSKAFRNWFGDWTKEDEESVSEVVDQNGEPLLVYHGTPVTDKIETFDKNKIGTNTSDRLTDEQRPRVFWFTDKKNIATNTYSFYEELQNPPLYNSDTDARYGKTIPVYLNVKNPYIRIQKGIKESEYGYYADESIADVLYDVAQHLKYSEYDGVKTKLIDSDQDDVTLTSVYMQYGVKESNQIKHAVLNKGTFSKQSPNIYNLAEDVSNDISVLTKSDFSQTFGGDVYNRLLAGEQISTQELLEFGMSDTDVFHGNLLGIAKILQRHNVPVIIAEGLAEGVVATTMTDEDGNSVIMINPDWINNVSKQRQGEIFIHEIMHAVVANALNAPKTAVEATFNKKTRKVFNQLKNAVRSEDWHLFDVYGGLYALCDVHEFVSEFISNANARSNIYALAKEIDEKSNKKAVFRLKQFVNSLFRLFVNKDLFSTESTIDQLKQYEKYLQDYLNGVNSASNTRSFSRDELIQAYHNIDEVTLNNDKISIQKELLHKGMISFQKHNIRLDFWNIDRIGKKDIPVKDKYNWIKNSLQSRINAIQTSRLPQDTKTVLMQETKGWLDQMNNPQVSTYESFSQLLNALGPRIISSLDELDRLRFEDTIDPGEYMFQAHDNIGTFDAILRDISVILKNESEVQDIVAQFNEQNEDSPITKDALVELQTAVEELSGLVSTAKGITTNLMNRVAISELSKVIKQAGSIEGMEMIENMISKNPVVEQDVSWFQVQFGQADASPNEIVRAVAHMIQKCNDKVDNLVLDKAIRLIELEKNLKDGESVLDLYETVDGKRTGFLVRQFNYGKYLQERDVFMKELNTRFGLPPKNNSAPLDEIEAIEWETARQEFLASHGEQRYIPEYYKKWAKVPRHVKEQIGKLNGAMIAILQKHGAIDENGMRHYEKITNDDDWKQFNSLRMSKRLMRETHDRFGNDKHGTELEDALTLQEVYKELYGTEYKQMRTKKTEWENARNEMIEKCGGQAEFDKYLEGKDSSFDFKTFDRWDARNSKVEFKRNASGKPIVFEDIEQEMHGEKIDYGEEYRKLKEKERALLRPIYDISGEPRPDLMEDNIKNILNNEIYPKLAEIRKKVIQSTPGYAKLAEASKALFDAYFKFEDTRFYRDIQQQISEDMMADDEFGFDIDSYQYALADYGILYEDFGYTYVIPYKWYQVLRTKDKDYMEVMPNEAWIEQDDDRSYDNPVWKEQNLDKVGLSVVPKMSLYKNNQWEKIQNSPTLKALYDEILSTMHESNQLQTNRTFTNDWQLPGVSGKLFDRLKQVKGIDKLYTFLKWAGEKLGIRIGQDQDVLLRGETTAHDDTTEEGEQIYSSFTKSVGRRGDGREYTALPQYFTRRLDNPEFTSGALLDIVLSYYKMSVNYSEKSKIKDTCDAILDYVKERKYNTGMSQHVVNQAKDVVKKALNLKGGDSTELTNIYKQLNDLINLGVYGKVKVQFKTKWFDFNKILDTTRQLTTATNLGMNKKVAAVGFMTAIHSHIVNALVGKEYNFSQLVESAIDVVKHIIYNGFKYGMYSRQSQDSLQVIMEEFGIAEQLERKMTDLDFANNRFGELRRMVKQNYVFGYLSTVDYLTKSQITVSTLKNYKYIDGEIYSNVDIQYMRHNSKQYKELSDKYKHAESIYDYIKVKKGRIHFEDANMQKAWNQNVGRIKAKCVKLAQRADGVATGLQRAAIQSSWIGMIIMIHRQFLPLMLQERYGDRVYDYDTQEYKNGQFRVLFKYLSELMMNNFLVGAPSAMLTLSFFISNPAWILGIGTALAGGFRIYGKHTGQNKSIKQINKEMFNTFDNQKSAINSMENRWAIKQIAIERALITLMSTLVVGPICKWADDDKDDFWLQTFAYWLKSSKWEITGPYNVEELIANIKSPTAMTSLLDRFNAVAANSNSGLINWLSSLSLTDDNDKVINKNSPYAGWTYSERSWFKALSGPISNEYEQDKAVGVYGKRKWMEKQNFHEHSGDNRNIYEEIRDLFRNAFE